MQAWHEKNLLDQSFPFRLFITEAIQFPPHWHEEIEIVYVLDGSIQMGVNNEIYNLGPKDILIIGSGDVHSYMKSLRHKIVIIQFRMSMLEPFSLSLDDRKFTKLMLGSSTRLENDRGVRAHKDMEKQILMLIEEYDKKQDGYQVALKARLYDLMVILLRRVPAEKYSAQEKSRHMDRLHRLEKVFQFVEENHEKEINLEEISKVANFSIFHFTRFFKEATGMTFGHYLSNFRVKRAEWYLINTGDSVTQVAFKVGFNSVKTFNRIFKEIKGCPPTVFKKAISEK